MARSRGSCEDRAGAGVPTQPPGERQAAGVSAGHGRQALHLRESAEGVHRRPASPPRNAAGRQCKYG